MLVRQTPAEATSLVQQSRVEFLMFWPPSFNTNVCISMRKFSHNFDCSFTNSAAFICTLFKETITNN